MTIFAAMTLAVGSLLCATCYFQTTEPVVFSCLYTLHSTVCDKW